MNLLDLRLFGLVTALLLLTIAGCDTGPPPIPPLPDAGPTMDAGTDAAVMMSDCTNGVRDGDESSADCGGSTCDPCASGDNCRIAEDCESMVCERGRCLVPNCRDGVMNGTETGTDCGGDCGLCPGGEPCSSNDQCISGRCRGGMCEPSSCEDGRMNADETDVDCGGPLCPACDGGLTCDADSDCVSLICAAGTCTDAACNDSVQNQDETSVDCGGAICDACRDGLACIIDSDCEGMRCFDGGCVSCTDMIMDAEETDVDCGGGLCAPCADGLMCLSGGDCESATCNSGICESCVDGVMNQDETDVDCGGAICGGCADGLVCTGDTDCGALGATCASGVCVSCADGVVNRDETDVDCGGAICPACAPGLLCTMSSDCASMICDGPTGRCNAPGCGDGILNGEETQVDCGGSMCLGCPTGGTCLLGRDCLDGVCTSGSCQAPTCTDGVANGLETDVDCGGSSSCPRCPDFDICTMPSDCVTAMCTMGRCGSTGCIPFPGTSTDSFGYFGCTIPMTASTLPCADISATGTRATLSDDSNQNVPIGFSFNFYGTAYTSLDIQSNGGVTFTPGYMTLGNACLPTATGRPPQISTWWDDLNPSVSGSSVLYETRGAAPNRELIVAWDTARFGAGTDRFRFTMVLHETSNDVDVCYFDATHATSTYNNGGSATFGIHQNATVGLQYSCNTASVTDGLMMLYVHP